MMNQHDTSVPFSEFPTGSAPLPDPETIRTFSIAYPPGARLLFLAVNGSYQYGYASEASDMDIRGIYALPEQDFLGLGEPKLTFTQEKVRYGDIEVEVVLHDLKKALKLLLNGNGNLIEWLFSPHLLYSTNEYWELRAFIASCLTRKMVSHYTHYAEDEWKQVMAYYQKHKTILVKNALHTFRLLLTGTHLMRTGEVETNVFTLMDRGGYDLFLSTLITKKQSGEKTWDCTTDPFPGDMTIALLQTKYREGQQRLQDATDASSLPYERESAERTLNTMLLSLRRRIHNRPSPEAEQVFREQTITELVKRAKREQALAEVAQISQELGLY